MKTIKELKAEIKDKEGLVSLMKWLAILNAVGGVWLGLQQGSMAVFLAAMMGALLFGAVWASEVAVIQRIKEEIRERN